MKKFAYLLLFIFVFTLCGCKDKPKDEPETPKVTVNVNDGTNTYDLMIEIGATYDLGTPVREGYTFKGWIDTTTNLFVKADFVFEEDMFIEAKWEKRNKTTFTYYYGTQIIHEDIVYSDEVYTPYTPELEGYDFVGWYTSDELKTEFTFNALSTRSNKVYCKFTPKTYTVSFEGTNTTIKVKYGNLFGALPTLTISKCSFAGWEYEGRTITDKTSYTYTSDIKLTPVITTSSTFHVDESSKVVTYTIGDYTPYVTAVKEGFIFAGWYKDANFSGDAIYVVDDTTYAGGHLYAKFVSSDADNSLSTKLIGLVKDYYINLYNNKIIYEDMSLPTKDSFYGCTMNWTSSNSMAVQGNGTVTRTKTNQDVTLNLTIAYGNVTDNVDIKVTVKGNIYKNIKNTKVIAGYVYTGTYSSRPVDDILLDTVDIIYLCFAAPAADGTLVVGKDWEAKLREFKDKADAKGVRVIMSIQGNQLTWTDIIKDDAKRMTYVNEILNAIIKYNIAGVDIDWEYPQDSGQTYTQITKDLYEVIKGYDPELLITSAIPAGPWGYPKYNLKVSSQYLDYINMMSYDLHCEAMLHHAALYKSSMTYNTCSIEESVNVYKSQGVPLDKIIIGAAFYGRYTEVTGFKYNSKTGTATGTVKKDGAVGKTIRYNSIVSQYLTNNPTATEYWDDTAKAPYIYDSATGIFVTYDNARSIKAKCEYVVTKGVGGIMWWDYGSDSSGELIEVIHSKLSQLKQ